MLSAIVRSTKQTCPEEVSKEGISVTWHKTPTAHNIESDPLCYRDEILITRNCSYNGWVPSLDDIGPCLKVVKYFDVNSCPPGFYKVSENINEFCYQIGEPSVWDSPCFSSGGASVITDLSAGEVDFLLNSLRSTNTSKYFWLPAARQKLFHPVVWTIPGPNWGQRVISSDFLNLYTPFTKNCLLLDIEREALVTDVCTKSYPTLCFYINDHYYPSRCPDGYQSFRFKHDNGTCFGIEKAEPGMSFNDFLQNKCKTPMVNVNSELSRFVFKKISDINNMTNDMWCWLKTYKDSYENDDEPETMSSNDSRIMKRVSYEGIVNSAGVLGYINSNTPLPCMACEVEIAYGKTEFMFEYNEAQNKIFLTVYYPSGLWKYDNTDKGIQCFSDAKGFFRVVDVNDLPFIEANSSLFSDLVNIEKIVYVIDLVTDSSAQYWCEGHTIDFNFISTDKIIANPKGNKIHVFALVIKYYVLLENVEEDVDLTGLTDNITDIFLAKKVLLMAVIDYSSDHMMILLHLHVDVDDIHDDEALNIQDTFNNLTLIAQLELPKYNYIFVNLSSSAVCLPTTSENVNVLDWEMTPIGHISAPKQFCLQANGLPVKRHCKGSYETGGVWGEVEGFCDSTYAPSEATAFLYNFVKRQMPNKYASRFLTDGLNFVLSDTDIIIPADIYYLSMSLQHVLDIAEQNATSVDTGDIENIAWVMDRMMVLDCNYLRLAQTLNSTNVILDSVSDIIELIAQRTLVDSAELSNVSYQFALKPQFIVQITYPEYNNITGIAVIRNSVSDNFADMLVQPLYKNTSIDEVLSIDKLEIATWLPEKVLNTLQRNTNESAEHTSDFLHIIITFFYNDAIFQELASDKHTVNSRIVGISIPEYISNLEYPVPLIFRQIKHTENIDCGYWDFQSQRLNHNLGSWKKQGCFVVKVINNKVVCECYHLTHFGQLLALPNNTDDEDNHISKNHTLALNIITLIGSFMSLLGICGIWITALVFSNWRKKAGTKVLLQLSTAIALPLVFILVFNLDCSMFIKVNDLYAVAEHKIYQCIILGALLHFSILSSFMWMLITAILQFIRYVRVLGVSRPSRFMVKFTLVGWGIPLLPVALTLALDAKNYIPSPSLSRSICYPNGYYMIASVLFPICLILCVNVTLFILVLHAISRGPDQKMKSTDMDLVGAQLRVSIFLFFLLGLTWVFGIFSFSNHLLWSYLFCLTSTLQGFVLFIYFVICDPNTRNQWITLMKPQFISNSSRNSITSITNG
ncbi:uncharacterized protein LOC111352983 [Spodoptera litura]|uniref:Uncharacterized protein LOC111352983 n=1 Tax=Spodoptera litura TaxID=69820 RepID=A0A9J7IPN8_SPOLT|nr:uncharacterized protein LOC111352983 [Spodoptera litura]